MRRDYIDFHHVAPHHQKVHERLENWGRWCIGAPSHNVHPMFRSAKPSQHWEAVEIRVPVDATDARKVEKAVGQISHDEGLAIRWCYVYQTTPYHCCRLMNLRLPDLWQLVQDGRNAVEWRLYLEHGKQM